MSEFECAQGHLMGSSHLCPECGGRAVRMDGMTARQMLQMQRAEGREQEEQEEEEDNG